MYQLTFTSWENDCDDYRDVKIKVSTKEDVAFYKDLAGMFNSTNSRENSGYGNDEMEAEVLLEIMADLLEEHPNVSESVKSLWTDVDSVYDNLCEYVTHSPIGYDYGFCRVVERFGVEEIIPGSLLNINESEVVFIALVNGKVKYRQQEFVTENGKINIFKVDWVLKEIDEEQVSVDFLKSPTKISKLVAQIKE